MALRNNSWHICVTMTEVKYFKLEQVKPIIAQELLKLLEEKLEELQRRGVKPQRVSFKPYDIYRNVLARLGIRVSKLGGISHPLFQAVRSLLEEAGISYTAEIRSGKKATVILSFEGLIQFVNFLRQYVASLQNS